MTRPTSKRVDHARLAVDAADPDREVVAVFRKSGKAIIALTVREILDEEIARKLA